MSKELTQLKEQVARAMLKGDWNGSLGFLLQAEQLAPRDTYVALKIGDMYQRLGKRHQAVEAYKRAATLFAAAGFLIKAISINKLILSLDPADKAVQSALTDLYSRQRGEFGGGGEDLPDHTSSRPSSRPAPGPVIHPEAALIVPEQEDAGIELPEIDLARVNAAQLPRTPLLSDLSKLELESVIDKLVVAFAAAGTLICREGETADSMYVIVHGLVRISSRDTEGNPLWLTNLHEGDFFGEFGLFSDGKRHADVIAVEDTELLQIGRRQLEEIIQEHPRVEQVLLAFYKERVVDTLLAKSALTRSLSPDQRRELLEHSALEIHERGSVIIQEGDDGMHLYVIKAGQVEVFTGLGDRRIDLAVLRPGDIFGEISVLTGTPTTANVVAAERVELVKFSRREVVAVAAAHPQLAHMLSETKEHRIHETVQRIQTEGFV